MLQLFQIMKLEIEEISALRSFVFLWCGSGEGLDLGRMVSPTLIKIKHLSGLNKGTLLPYREPCDLLYLT